MHTMSAEQLHDCLAAVEAVDLLGLRLLRAHARPDDLPRETLTEAVTEIVDYTGRCAATARRLSDLTPVPLTTLELLEFGL